MIQLPLSASLARSILNVASIVDTSVEEKVLEWNVMKFDALMVVSVLKVNQIICHVNIRIFILSNRTFLICDVTHLQFFPIKFADTMWNGHECVYRTQCSCRRGTDGVDYPVGVVQSTGCEEW